MMKKLIVILSVALLSGCSYFDSSYSKTSLSFMEEIKKGNTEQAYKLIFYSNKTPASVDVLNRLVKKTNEKLKAAGPIFAYEEIQNIKMGSRFGKATYMAYHHKMPTLWEFHFMKTEKGEWLPLGMDFKNKPAEF